MANLDGLIKETSSTRKEYYNNVKQMTITRAAKTSKRNHEKLIISSLAIIQSRILFVWCLCNCIVFLVEANGFKKCAKHTFSTGEYDIACACNDTYCDNIKFEWPNQEEILVVESDKTGGRFDIRLTNYFSNIATEVVKLSNNAINQTTESTLTSASTISTTNSTIDAEINLTTLSPFNNANNNTNADNNEPLIRLKLYPERRMQKILGFGGSFTDAATYQFQTMSKKMRRFAMEDYFGLHGLRYNLGRVPIAGSDFSSRPYTYADLKHSQSSMNEDLNLTGFRLQPEDIALKIPIIRQAMHMVQDTSDYKQKLNLVASSWSPPAWMKDNNHLVKGKLKGNSSQSYYEAYARYYVKLLQEYKSHGIKFWALTSQNEPKMCEEKIIQFNCMIFNKDELRDFVLNSLGPILEKSGFGKENLQLLVYDDNTNFLEDYVKSMYANETEAAKYISGVAVHWYKRKLTGYGPLENVRKLIPSPDIILSTEACVGNGTKPGRWESGVEYASDIIQTLRHQVVGWIDWNMALDMSGGPNWAGNYVDSPMLFDESKKVYYKNPMYYTLAHFTRFFEPGAQVFESEIHQQKLAGNDARDSVIVSSNIGCNGTINITSEPNKGATDLAKQDIEMVASLRPSKSHYSVVILNKSNKSKLVNVEVEDQVVMEKLTLKPNSITTLAIPNRSSQIYEAESEYQNA